MLRESMARKIWILHEFATLGPSGPTRNMALAVCVSVVVLLCGAPSPCYALLNTSECAHTPRVLSLPSAQACKHTHLGEVAPGEKKTTEHKHIGGIVSGLGRGSTRCLCVLVSAHSLVGKRNTNKQTFQKVPGQSWENYVYRNLVSPWFPQSFRMWLGCVLKPAIPESALRAFPGCFQSSSLQMASWIGVASNQETQPNLLAHLGCWADNIASTKISLNIVLVIASRNQLTTLPTSTPQTQVVKIHAQILPYSQILGPTYCSVVRGESASVSDRVWYRREVVGWHNGKHKSKTTSIVQLYTMERPIWY